MLPETWQCQQKHRNVGRKVRSEKHHSNEVEGEDKVKDNKKT